jgi:hypothetical protein
MTSGLPSKTGNAVADVDPAKGVYPGSPLNSSHQRFHGSSNSGMFTGLLAMTDREYARHKGAFLLERGQSGFIEMRKTVPAQSG